MKVVLTAFLVWVLAAHGFAQIEGGGGAIFVSGNPNTLVPAITVGEHAMIAVSKTLNKMYVYNQTLPSGQRWQEVATGSNADTDTYMDSPFVQNDSLKFIRRDKAGVEIGQIGIPTSAFTKNWTYINPNTTVGMATFTPATPPPNDLLNVVVERNGVAQRVGTGGDPNATVVVSGGLFQMQRALQVGEIIYLKYRQ
jgi:hypothetical protein